MQAKSFEDELTFFLTAHEINEVEADWDHGFTLDGWADWLLTMAPEFYFRPALLPPPTKALPGSEAKIKVLRRRMRRGQKLWNDDGDLKWEDVDAIGERIETQPNGRVRRLGLVVMGKHNGVSSDRQPAPAA